MAFAKSFLQHRSSLGLAFAATALLATPAIYAQKEIAAPAITKLAADRGFTDLLQESTVTVHLKLPNEAAYNKAIEDLYTPGSATYHQWMTKSDFAKYAPSPANVQAVKKELQAHGLSIVSVDPNGYSIRARGTVNNISDAFNTQIHDFVKAGKTFHANVTPARLSGATGDLVHSVSGLSSYQLKPYLKSQVNPRTGKKAPTLPVSKATSATLGTYFTPKCFEPPAAVSLTTYGAALPTGQYFGNRYDAITKTCGYTAKQLQDHYGLTGVYKKSIAGEGQTIVIIDGPSSDFVTADLAAYSQLSGLPAQTSSNFQILYPDGKPTVQELQEFGGDAADETDLDIESAHAIAPNANIILIILPTFDWPEFEYAIQYAVQNKLGNVISISYGLPEVAWGAYELNGFEAVIKQAAAAGIAVNISSGDGGDEGTGAPNAGGASYPGASAYATSVGGTSLDIPTATGGLAEVGWGNNGTYLSFASDFVLDPPFNLGFLGGSGGGESTFVAKPSWQSAIPGVGRQQPDIAAVADPYTGAIIVYDSEITVFGGTSLASPVFSGIWTLANQKAGKSLGQAAPLLSRLTSVINDVVPVGSPTNPSGTIYDSAGSTFYSSDALLAPLGASTTYSSALWNLGFGEYVDLSFGTDSTLATTTGWDNVTGYGVPNGLKFVLAAAALK